MFVSFDPFTLLFWILITSFIPGAILSIGLFRKSEFTFTEKVLTGFGLGLFLLPLIPFLLYFIAGINYSFEIAVLSTVLFYVVSLAIFAKGMLEGAYGDFKLPDKLQLPITKNMLISASVIVIVLIAFWIRMSSYSPVFQELDPYYYTYAPYQLLTLGENPQDDQTAWYPEVVTSHRIVPTLSYMEALWYSFYTGGAEADNMLLAVISSIYPAVMAALAFFFLYLFLSSSVRREWAVVGAGIASFAPILIYKTLAGEQEVQPYAFFALALFMAMYAFMVKKKDMKFAVLAGLGFMAVSLGSSSQILALAFLVLFIIIQSVLMFLRDDGPEEFKTFLANNSIVLLLGPIIGTSLTSTFFSSTLYLGSIGPAITVLALVGALYLIKLKAPDRKAALSYFVVLLGAGLIVFFATPVGGYITSIGKSGFGIASFNNPLDRTIAEQGVSGGMLASQVGFVAEAYPEPIAFIMLLPSVVTNWVLGFSVTLLNSILGTEVSYAEKSSSFLLLWILLFFIAMAYAFYRFMKGTDRNSLVVLFAAVVLPPLLVGIIKAKYTIYTAFMIAAAIAFVLGVGEQLISRMLEKISKNEESAKLGISQTYYAILAIGVLLLVFQFLHNGYAPAILQGSFSVRFQDNPMALQEKFSDLCTLSGDPDVCSASQDPMAYADRGTNYQYDSKLCYYSLIEDPANIKTEEYSIIQTRCHRISPYWTESMEWIRYNTEADSRTTSWWDYGHWINYFGLKNTVLRNEHLSQRMIGEVAHAYIDGTPGELKSFMETHDSEYALFDMELVSSGTVLGGKYGALNYLSCARNNETSVSYTPGQSACEADHLWEVILIPSDPVGRECTISGHAGIGGVTAYRVLLSQTTGPVELQYYPGYCVNPSNQNDVFICQNYVILEPAYCLGAVTLADGQQTYATYYLDQTYPNGDLKLNKAFLQFPQAAGNTYHVGDATMFTLLYTEDKIWLENGEVKGGYEDRKGKFYDSNLYRALFLENIPGFNHVYSTSDGMVKIFKIAE